MTIRPTRLLGPALAVALVIAAVFILDTQLSRHDLGDIQRALRQVSPLALLAALTLTVLDYAALSLQELLGTRYAGSRLPFAKVAAAAAAASAFSQALGFPLFTGTPVRYRLYSGWGLRPEQFTQIVAFVIATMWLGFFTLEGILLSLNGSMQEGVGRLPATRPIGLLLLVLTAAYVTWTIRADQPIKVWRWTFPAPSLRSALLQVLLGPTEWALAGSVFFILLPAGHGHPFLAVLGVYLVAQTTGLLSGIPAGLGVFEAAVLLLLPGDEGLLLASLVAYRVVYHLVPLLLAILAIGAMELQKGGDRIEEAIEMGTRAASAVAPAALAALTLLSGVLLLLTGSIPVPAGRLAWLGRTVPLPLLELSNFLGSLVGVMLLVLSRGLQARLDGAFHATVALVCAGILLTVGRGGGAIPLLSLVLLLGLLLVSRREFFRRSSVFREPISPAWLAAIGAMVVLTTWIGIFAYGDSLLSSDRWWTFTLSGQAPRFARATVGATVLLFVVTLTRLIRAATPRPAPASESELDLLDPLVAASDRANAHLAFLGDKQIIRSEREGAFVMYGIERRTWITMGDPIGDPAEYGELLGRLRAEVRRYDGNLVCYQVMPQYLPLYLDLGLYPLKLGEEGFVPLDDFSLDGPGRADLRRTVRRIEGGGGEFRIVPATEVPRLLPALRAISDAWLERKNAREKGFSLGSFRESYLRRFPVAILVWEGRPVAFANLWAGSNKNEVSVDLLRYGEGAPPERIDYLLAKLMLWGRENGYANFGLGMAPLAGLEGGPLQPLWNRLGAAVYRYGEHFYNFQGLREYKEGFHPVWEPRYLMTSSRFNLPLVLTDVAALIAGDLIGIVRR